MDIDKIDLMTEVDLLRRGWQACEARLAAVEAERDAARAASEKDREWLGRALETQAEYLGQSQMLVAERDAARTGEARAVEALRDFVMYARGDLAGRNLDGPERHGLAEGYWDGVRAVVDRLQALLDSLGQPALTWLAQQRAAAAAKAEAVAVKFLGNMADEHATGRRLRQPYTTGYADALYHAHDKIQEHFAALRAGKGVGDE